MANKDLSAQVRESKNLKKVVLTQVKPQANREELYQRFVKNLKKQGIEVKSDNPKT